MVKLTCFKSLYNFFLILKCYIELMANKFLKILSSGQPVVVVQAVYVYANNCLPLHEAGQNH